MTGDGPGRGAPGPGWWLRRPWSVSGRLGLATAVVLAVLGGNLAVTAASLGQLNQQTRHLEFVDVPLRNATGRLLTALVQEESGLRGFLLTGDQAFLRSLRRGQTASRLDLATLHRLAAPDARVSPALQAVVRALDRWRSRFEAPQLAARAHESTTEILAQQVRGLALFDAIRTGDAALLRAVDRHINGDFAVLQRTGQRGLAIAGLAAALSALAVALALLRTRRAIRRPLRRLQAVARALVLERPPPPPGGDPAPTELAELDAAFTLAGQRLLDRQADLVASNQELARASRVKSQFLATVSHEVRTPLNSIVSFTDLLLIQEPQALSPRALDYVQRIERNGRHLRALLDEILDLSRIEAGRLVLAPVVVGVDEPLAAVVTAAAALAQAKHIDCRVEDGVPGGLAVADPRALAQILTNLVTNAITATEQGGVGLRVRPPTEPGTLRIEVSDTGPGIPSHQRDAIFEAFVQLDRSRAASAGAGLGLSISRRLARLMHGDLTVRSAPGRGARFTLSLPAVHGASAAVAAGRAPAVLVGADRDGAVLRRWASWAERLGLAYAGLRIGPSTADALADLQPRAVLLDLRGARPESAELLRALRAAASTRALPVLARVAGPGRPPHAADPDVRLLPDPGGCRGLAAAIASLDLPVTEPLA